MSEDIAPPILKTLLTRRSVSAKELREPGPSRAELDLILQAGARVPDHGKTVPFYFIIFEGTAREQAGEIFKVAYLKNNPDKKDSKAEEEKSRFLRAPLVIGVIYRKRPGKHPLWEQMMSVGAVCQNIVLAASGFGYGGQWLSEWIAYDDAVLGELGLDERDSVAGFLHIGSYDEEPKDRERPELDKITNHWMPGAKLNKGDEYDREKHDFPPLGLKI